MMCVRMPLGKCLKASSGCLLFRNDVLREQGADTVPVLSPMASSKMCSSESCWSFLDTRNIQPAPVIKNAEKKKEVVPP